ncbi:MAG TPA: hypothetical protein VGR06_41090 [Actinophytocola sp.]|uniref:hypothetical protein n=1 Tax=Actinophytocola sp. TaxID=1872138 RepID=UPI002E035FF3|nr:hypothetical protein [Actinophytocola sp.]
MKRQFTAGAPNRLRVADFTYVAIWAGTACVAFAVDVFSRGIVGWRASMPKETDLVPDSIDMGLQHRDYRPGDDAESWTSSRWRRRSTPTTHPSRPQQDRRGAAELGVGVGRQVRMELLDDTGRLLDWRTYPATETGGQFPTPLTPLPA